MGKYIPEEITIKILSKLPVRSLFRFKSVSHSWLTLISDTHLNLLGTRRVAAAVIQNTEPSQSELHLLGSCNGLLLLNFGEQFFLFNPTTNDCKHLFTTKTRNCKRYYVHGLCYYPIKDDYLAVIGCLGNPASAHVFRVKQGTLNEVQLGNYQIYNEYLGVVCNGRMHWLVSRPMGIDRCSTRHLLCFDPLKEDGFTELALPSKELFIGSCGVLWESVLCLTMNDWKTKSVKVMAMWEDCSWSTVFVITCELVLGKTFEVIKPLCFSNDGEIILLVGGLKLMTYCPRRKVGRVVGSVMGGNGNHGDCWFSSISICRQEFYKCHRDTESCIYPF